MPKHEQRLLKLRTGAEDELSHQQQTVSRSVKSPPLVAAKTEISKERHTSGGKTAASEPTTTPKIIDIAMPKHLSEPFDYPQMHIFVSLFF